MTRRKTYQQGSVSEKPRKSKCFSLRYRELDHRTGKWKVRRVALGKFDNITAARSAAAPIMAQVNERNNTEPRKHYTDITFKEFIETRWRAYTVQEKHQISTLDLRNRLIKTHLLPFFGKMPMRRIEPTDIADFLEKKQPDYSGNMMRTLFSMLRLLFDLAAQYDLIDKSPVRPKRHRPKMEKVVKPTLTAKQIQTVLQHLDNEQERLLVLLLAVTGMRVCEALALRWVDFDAPGLELAINHTLYRGKLKAPKTATSKSKLRLHPSMAALLVAQKWRSSFQNGVDFIFCLPDGKPFTYWTSLRRFHKAVEDAGITRSRGKHGFHILRHSAGTLLYEMSRDLKLVQGTLRHADISTTSDIYVHLGDKVLREGSERLTEEILKNCDLFVTQNRKKVG